MFTFKNILATLAITATVANAIPFRVLGRNNPHMPIATPIDHVPPPTDHMIYINGTVGAPGSPSPDKEMYNMCYNSDGGTCTVGLVLTGDQSKMEIFIYNSECRLIGNAGGLHFDDIVSISSELPYMVVVSPHIGWPPEFWYAGDHYQNGWDFTWGGGDHAEFYNRIVFWCNK